MSHVVAQYASWCGECDEPINVGDVLRVARSGESFGKWVHDVCPSGLKATPPCPACWLTSCDCGRDT